MWMRHFTEVEGKDVFTELSAFSENLFLFQFRLWIIKDGFNPHIYPQQGKLAA